MCGITGIFNLSHQPVSIDFLHKMANAISHRGPDGEGFYTEGCVGLAHRRLAIIDLSVNGHQPMATLDKRYIITYNGEVYNFKELRIELEKLGYIFYSKTDSEVVLNAYIAWGSKCLLRFNGMFAFAIWDKKKQELFLARDRYGIKPLYYGFFNGNFLFGSEKKAILAHPIVIKTVDKEALLEYFTFQNIFTDKTFFNNIKMFPAGCWTKLKSGLGDSSIHPVVYWDFNFQETKQIHTETEYIEELDRLFTQAVNRQLVSDVELGSYLSGGMDSGSITAIAARQRKLIKTFTCGFDLQSASGLELGFDERHIAEYTQSRRL